MSRCLEIVASQKSAYIRPGFRIPRRIEDLLQASMQTQHGGRERGEHRFAPGCAAVERRVTTVRCGQRVKIDAGLVGIPPLRAMPLDQAGSAVIWRRHRGDVQTPETRRDVRKNRCV